MKVWMVVAVALLAGGKKGRKDAGTAAPAPPPPVAQAVAAPPADPWEFDGLIARVAAKGETTDELSTMALTQLGIRLEGTAVFKVSAQGNSVGGVTLTLADPADPKVACALYATREEDRLIFKDSRCSFPVLGGELRTTATCRKISGTARRAKDTISLEAATPDCTAQLMGFSLTVRATAKPP